MTLPLIIVIASWILILSLITGLCGAARLGDQQQTITAAEVEADCIAAAGNWRQRWAEHIAAAGGGGGSGGADVMVYDVNYDVNDPKRTARLRCPSLAHGRLSRRRPKTTT